MTAKKPAFWSQVSLHAIISSIQPPPPRRLILAAALLAAPTVVIAQDYTSGNLTGAVISSAGAPVSGAAVRITSAQGTQSQAVTDARGSFEVRALPVGSYEAVVSAEGFEDTRLTLSISPGGASYDFVLQRAGETTEVVVRGARRNSFSRNTVGLTVDVQETADKIPVARSINAITLLTPGASLPDATINASARRNQSLISLSGTSAAETSYYINGVQVTDQRNLLGYAELPFEFIQTIETKAGGYEAEFGRGTGGVVNIVTRSGTNRFEFGASVYTTPDWGRSERGLAYNAAGNAGLGVRIYNQQAESDASELTLYAGGPLVEDKLFVFVVANPKTSESWSAATVTETLTGGITGIQTRSKTTNPRYGLKLDWVITPDHRLEYTAFHDKETTEYQDYFFDEATQQRTFRYLPTESKAGGLNQILKYTGRITDWFTLSALYGRVEATVKDEGPGTQSPAIYDYAKGAYLNNISPGLFDLDGKDTRTTYRLSGDFYFDFAGRHHLRVGYDREELRSDAYSAYGGGAIYYGDYDTNGGGTYLARLTYANVGTFEAEQTAVFIQDSWRITPNFSLQLGLRNDIYDYKNAAGQSYVKVDDQWAPRLGFNWDPTGEGVHRIYGSVGDYYLPIGTNTSIRASSGEVYTYEYFYESRDANGDLVLDATGAPVLGAVAEPTDYLSPPSVPDPEAIAQRDLKPTYEREFILGYEHSFREGWLTDWRVGARVIYRELKRTIEDTAIGDAVDRWATRNGVTAGDVDAFPYVLFNPGEEATVYVDLQARGRDDPDYDPQWITLSVEDLAFPKAKREYKALELTFERPYNGLWGLAGSYTLARSYGNYEGAIKSDIGQTDPSLTQDFDHASSLRYAEGYLPNHHLHTLKLYGTWTPRDWLTVGANFTVQSGRKYGAIGYTPLADDPYSPQSATPSSWVSPLGEQIGTTVINGKTYARYASIVTPRGSQGTTPTTYQLDLSFGFKLKEFDNSSKVDASIDIFNVFDNDEVLRVVERAEVVSTTAQTTRKGIRQAYYGQPRTYQAPRQIRFGLKYRY